MHYYKFNIKDWSRDTAHLTVEEEGVYRRLVDLYYESEIPIPEKTQLVIRRLRLSGYEQQVSTILEEFFRLCEDGYRHTRCDDEIARYHAKAQSNRRNGASGGRPKKPNENPDGYQEQPSRNLNQEPLTINQEEDQKHLPQPMASTGLGATFDGTDFTVSDEQIEKWEKAYPTADVRSEIRKAATWAAANPAKAKKNWARFLNTWIAKVGLAAGPVEGSCPVDKIIDMYHRECHSFAPVAVKSDKALRSAIVERWMESANHQQSPFWVSFFRKARNKTSVFYRGENCLPRLEALMSRAIFREIEELA